MSSSVAVKKSSLSSTGCMKALNERRGRVLRERKMGAILISVNHDVTNFVLVKFFEKMGIQNKERVSIPRND